MSAIATLLLGVSVLAGVIRVLRRGTLADRVVGFDVALLAGVGIIAVDAAVNGRTWLLEALPIIGLLAVLGTIALATAIGRGR